MLGFETPINHGVTGLIRLIIPWGPVEGGGYTLITETGDVYHTPDDVTAATLVVALGFDVVFAASTGDSVYPLDTPILAYLIRRDTGEVRRYNADGNGPTFTFNTSYAKGASVRGLPISVLIGTSFGTAVGTTAGEVCGLANPYNPGAPDTIAIVAGSSPRYLGRTKIYTDTTVARMTVGCSAIVPDTAFATFTDHDAVITAIDTAAPGTEYYGGWGRSDTKDIAAATSWAGNGLVRLYQKAFAATAWALAHTFPGGTDGGADAAFFNFGGGTVLAWLSSPYAILGGTGFAYSLDDGVTWTDQTINANVNQVYVMSYIGATFYAIVRNVVSGDIELWSAAAVTGPWALVSTVAAFSGSAAAVIDVANLKMFVNSDGVANYSAVSPFAVWTTNTGNSNTGVIGFVRAGSANRLYVAFLNTAEESDDGGVTWFNPGLSLIANELVAHLAADQRIGAAQKVVLITSGGRFITAQMDLTAPSAPAYPTSGSGIRNAIVDLAWNGDSGVGLYALAPVPLERSLTPTELRTIGHNLNSVAMAVNDVGVVAYMEAFNVQTITGDRFVSAVPCFRPSGDPNRGAFGLFGETTLVMTNAAMTANVQFNGWTDPPSLIASGGGGYLVVAGVTGDIYGSGNGSAWSIITGTTPITTAEKGAGKGVV